MAKSFQGLTFYM